VVEDGGAQVEDEALADARREPALGDRQRGAQHRQPGDRGGDPDHDVPAVGRDAVVDEDPQQPRRQRTGRRVERDEQDEEGELPAVGPSEAEDAAQGGAAEALGRDGRVLRERAEHAAAAHARAGDLVRHRHLPRDKDAEVNSLCV
jgi:hypothetical protein